MNRDKPEQVNVFDGGNWPQNQFSVLAIVIALIMSFCYLIYSIIEVLETLRRT